jgi:hypothetical protein
MINFIQKDYEYLQTFLSMNISDQEIVHLLNKSSPIQQISTIINLLRTGEKTGSNLSRKTKSSFINRLKKLIEFLVRNIPNHDKWIRSRKSSLSLFEFLQYVCCCQRRNRVTTDTS